MRFPFLRWVWRIGPIIVIFLLASWWFYLRPAAPTFYPRVTWHDTQLDSAVSRVAVRVTRRGVPVSEYEVGVEHLGGGTITKLTDSTGAATLTLGSSYPWTNIVALHLDHRRIALRPLPGGEYFTPSAFPYGITFDVSL